VNSATGSRKALSQANTKLGVYGMNKLLRLAAFAALTLVMGMPAFAANCGNDGGGFEAWKVAFEAEAKAKGIGAKGIAALTGTRYATATIHADRSMRSFKLSLAAFMEKRGSAAIIARGRSLKTANAALFAGIQKRFGVPSGPLIAIWGMESGFGGSVGNQNVFSAVATLAYDCRRSEFFTDQLYSALKLADRGILDQAARGAMQGEIGQTQFLPKNVLLYGAGNLNSKAGALMSTANFLKAHGWVAGQGYQPGQPNFAAIAAWNDASVYQQAIAIMGSQIDAQ
jgi:membrane-bound lytic murein transglycosylase B